MFLRCSSSFDNLILRGYPFKSFFLLRRCKCCIFKHAMKDFSYQRPSGTLPPRLWLQMCGCDAFSNPGRTMDESRSGVPGPNSWIGPQLVMSCEAQRKTVCSGKLLLPTQQKQLCRAMMANDNQGVLAVDTLPRPCSGPWAWAWAWAWA